MVSWVYNIKCQGRVLVCGAKIILKEFSIWITQQGSWNLPNRNVQRRDQLLALAVNIRFVIQQHKHHFSLIGASSVMQGCQTTAVDGVHVFYLRILPHQCNIVLADGLLKAQRNATSVQASESRVELDGFVSELSMYRYSWTALWWPTMRLFQKQLTVVVVDAVFLPLKFRHRRRRQGKDKRFDYRTASAIQYQRMAQVDVTYVWSQICTWYA